MSFVIELPDETESEAVARRLARVISAPLVLGFSGDIGAGKTTLIRALLRAIGIQCAIKSPTYALVESYFTNDLHLHHFDLYRVQEDVELDYLGFRDYFTTQAVLLIEWPEQAESAFNCLDLHLTLTQKGLGRELYIMAKSRHGRDVLSLF